MIILLVVIIFNFNYVDLRESEAHSASIVGGVPVKLQRFPYNVQIYNLGNMCGGVILSQKIVLTAAHCFDFNRMLAEIYVVSNTRYIYDSKSRKHDVWALRIHDRYNATIAFENDIALILIRDYFKYGVNVQKAFLCTNNIWMRDNENFLVAGWGETEFGEGVRDQVLRMTYMEFVSKDKCMRENHAYLTKDMFCLYGDGLRDACRGDSGGGVFWKDMLVGIVSHGKGCAWTPSVFANIYYLRPWIERNVYELYAYYCSYGIVIK